MDGSLMKAQQPSFQQEDYPGHTRKETLPFPLSALHLLVMHIVYQREVRLEFVCAYGATWLNRVGNETVKTFLVQVRNVPNPITADAVFSFLSGNDDSCLVFRQPSHKIFLPTAPVRFIHLKCSPQAIPTRTNHYPSQFVEPFPRCHIAPESKCVLKTHRAGISFQACNIPDSPKIYSQRFQCVLKYRLCCHRRLMPSCPTNQKPLRSQPAFGSAASPGHKPF
jgi:hypothetical protein